MKEPTYTVSVSLDYDDLSLTELVSVLNMTRISMANSSMTMGEQTDEYGTKTGLYWVSFTNSCGAVREGSTDVKFWIEKLLEKLNSGEEEK